MAIIHTTSLYRWITQWSSSIYQAWNLWISVNFMMTPSNGNIFRVTGHLWGNAPITGGSPQKGQWRRVLVFYLICTWTDVCTNNRTTSDLRRHRAPRDITVMLPQGLRLDSVNNGIMFQLSSRPNNHIIKVWCSKKFLVMHYCPQHANLHWDWAIECSRAGLLCMLSNFGFIYFVFQFHLFTISLNMSHFCKHVHTRDEDKSQANLYTNWSWTLLKMIVNRKLSMVYQIAPADLTKWIYKHQMIYIRIYEISLW